jgi:glycerol uptake facilitator-like aquaporin
VSGFDAHQYRYVSKWELSPSDAAGCAITPLSREPLTAQAAAELVVKLKALSDPVRLRLLSVVGLAVLILLFGPVSGAHFNPVVSAADWLLGRRAGTGITASHVVSYTVAQTLGGIVGAWLANLMFDRNVFEIATKERITTGHLVGEVVATAGLIALIFALARSGRAALSAAAVGAYIGAAYWFTSSTSFANPAVTIGRIFSDSFAGIALSSAPGFIAAQIVGALIGLALVIALYPDAFATAGDAVVPHHDAGRASRRIDEPR